MALHDDDDATQAAAGAAQAAAPDGEIMTKDLVRRLTLSLPTDVYDEMKALADERRISMTELIRRAISREKFFHEHRDQKVILRSDDNAEQVVVML